MAPVTRAVGMMMVDIFFLLEGKMQNYSDKKSLV